MRINLPVAKIIFLVIRIINKIFKENIAPVIVMKYITENAFSPHSSDNACKVNFTKVYCIHSHCYMKWQYLWLIDWLIGSQVYILTCFWGFTTAHSDQSANEIRYKNSRNFMNFNVAHLTCSVPSWQYLLSGSFSLSMPSYDADKNIYNFLAQSVHFLHRTLVWRTLIVSI